MVASELGGAPPLSAPLRFGLSAAAAGVAEAATFPVDLVKTRLQLQGQAGAGAGAGAGAAARAGEAAGVRGEGARVAERGAGAIVRDLVRRDGPRALYRGLSPAVLRHVPYTGTRVLLYEELKRAAAGPAGAPDAGGVGIGAKLGMGFVSGGVAQAIAVPMDLAKVRMQADAGSSHPRYRGTWHALSTVAGEEGVRGLWRGTSPAIFRAAMVNLGELATYDTAKRAVERSGAVPPGPATHLAAATCSGFFASLASTPADVVKTRMMNAPGAYRTPIHCLVATARGEGPRALFRGFFPTWLRIGPWQLTFWVAYEHLRTLAGADAF